MDKTQIFIDASIYAIKQHIAKNLYYREKFEDLPYRIRHRIHKEMHCNGFNYFAVHAQLADGVSKTAIVQAVYNRIRDNLKK